MYSVDGTAVLTGVECPNCHQPMVTRRLEAHATLHPIDVEVCTGCTLFWFDWHESISLAPKSVLSLFQLMGEAAAGNRMPLGSSMRCPRCASALAVTHDLQRATHFSYWRCPNGHGKLITFTQFLREKNFVRPPSPDELSKLRKSVRQIACSQCGAPVNLANESACSHCGAPIALIDSEGVAKALHEFSTAASSDADAERLSTALRDAQVNAIFEAEHAQESADRRDLVAVGAGAIATLLTALIFGRA